MKYRLITFLAIALSTSSCIKTKSEKKMTFIMKPEEYKTLKQQCAAINAEGDIFALNKSLNRQLYWTLDVLEKDHPENFEADLKRVNASMLEILDRIDRLMRPEWATSIWTQKIEWLINEDDFRDQLGANFNNGLEITSYKVVNATLKAVPRPDLIPELKIKKAYSSLAIELTRKTTAMDICQLQKTLVFTVKVEYRNIRNYQVRYFNLNVK
jgi:hypothetical protein